MRVYVHTLMMMTSAVLQVYKWQTGIFFVSAVNTNKPQHISHTKRAIQKTQVCRLKIWPNMVCHSAGCWQYNVTGKLQTHKNRRREKRNRAYKNEDCSV